MIGVTLLINTMTARNYSPSLTITNLTYGDGYVLYPDQIGIYNPLKLSFIINPEPPGVVGQEFTFTDTSPDNLVKWEWDFDDTTPKIPGNPVKTQFHSKNHPMMLLLPGWNKYGASDHVSRLVEIINADNSGNLTFVPDNITLINGSNNDRQINILLDRGRFRAEFL